MVFLAVSSLLIGIFCGLIQPDSPILSFITSGSNIILYLLMFLVGISIGLNKDIVTRIKSYGFKIFIIPIGVIAGSFVGGVVCSFITNIALNQGTAIAGGMGWYSLAGVMLSELGGADLGSIAFLSNLLREIISFVCIPFIAKHLNYFTCIAPAGATSEDTTLPMMIRYTNEETVVLSLFNGVLCSAAVPFMIDFCYKILPAL